MDTDRIIMRKHGLPRVEKRLLGRITQQVLTRAAADVQVVGKREFITAGFSFRTHPAMMKT